MSIDKEFLAEECGVDESEVNNSFPITNYIEFKSMYREEEFLLKTCPICSKEPTIKHIGNSNTNKRSIEIRCKSCNLLMKQSAIHRSMDWLEDIVVDMWNNRS